MKTENQKWIYTSFGILGLLLWIILTNLFNAIFATAKISVMMIFDKISLTSLASLVISVFTLYVLMRKEVVYSYSNDVVIELKKVSWPTRKETSGSTIVVLIVVFLFSIYLSFFDLIWTKLLQLAF